MAYKFPNNVPIIGTQKYWAAQGVDDVMYQTMKLAYGSTPTDVTTTNPLPVSQSKTESTSGAQTRSFSLDDETHNLLQDILIEQRIMNVHLQSMTNMHITREDVRED